MSTFFRSPEQVKRDRALQQGRAPESAAPTASTAPEARIVERVRLQEPPADSSGGADDHLVSLVAPATFEAEQYRALRHTVEQLRETRDLRIFVSGELALAHWLWHLTGVDKDHPAAQMWMRSTAGYQRKQGKWQIVHEHCSVPFDPFTGKAVFTPEP